MIKEFCTNLVRKIFRYKLTAVFFVVGQLIVYYAVFGALGIYNKAFDKEEERLAAIYDNRIQLEVTTFEGSDIFSNAGLGVEAGNAVINGKVYLSMTDMGQTRRCEVILKMNEEMPYQLISGRLPGSEESDRGRMQVALSRNLCEHLREEDGKQYLVIANEMYEVVGIIGSDKSDYWDNKVVLNVDCIGENTLKSIMEKKSYTIELSSNTYDLQESYSKLYGNIKSIEPDCAINAKKLNTSGDSTIVNTLYKEKLKVNVIVYVFCIFNCMVISEFWIIQRKKELAVKKAFGMGNARIIWEIASNILSLSAVALVIFIAGNGILQLLPLKSGLDIAINGTNGLLLIGAVLVTVVAALIYPVYKVLRFAPVQSLGSGE